MAIENTSLYEELQRIVTGGQLPVHAFWSCEIKAGEQVLVPHQVLSIDIIREYDKTYSDLVFLELAIMRGVYIHQIVPFKDDLIVTLKRNPIVEVGDEENFDEDVQLLTMRAFLIDQSDPVMENRQEIDQSPDLANHAGLMQVKFQLVDLALEQLRMKTIGGIFREQVPADVLKALLGYSASTIDVDQGARVRGVDMAPPSNTTVRDHVIIPHGTPLMQLPAYIQDHAGGIYSAGCRHYLQGGIWYVYPEFDVTRFDSTPRSMSIVNVPPNKYPGIERTYSYEGGKLVVLSTGPVKVHDDSESLQLNQGNGVRFASADRIMEGFTETVNNITTASRAENTAEFLARGRKTGLNHVTFSSDRILSNSFRETSKLARRLVAHMEVVWENSNGELIYPGMPVRVLYTVNEDVAEVYGVVLRAHTHIRALGRGTAIGRHRSDTHLTLLIERPPSA